MGRAEEAADVEDLKDVVELWEERHLYNSSYSPQTSSKSLTSAVRASLSAHGPARRAAVAGAEGDFHDSHSTLKPAETEPAAVRRADPPTLEQFQATDQRPGKR